MVYERYLLNLKSVIIVTVMFELENTGTVTLSPSGVAPVCSGDQLELICTTTEDLLQWRFSLIRGNETFATEFSRTVRSNGVSQSQLEVNSIVFSFSRTTSHSSVPVTSILSIGSVPNSLNGTVINCVTSEVSSTTIIVRRRDSIQGMIHELYYRLDIIILSNIITYNMECLCYPYL